MVLISFCGSTYQHIIRVDKHIILRPCCRLSRIESARLFALNLLSGFYSRAVGGPDRLGSGLLLMGDEADDNMEEGRRLVCGDES